MNHNRARLERAKAAKVVARARCVFGADHERDRRCLEQRLKQAHWEYRMEQQQEVHAIWRKLRGEG